MLFCSKLKNLLGNGSENFTVLLKFHLIFYGNPAFLKSQYINKNEIRTLFVNSVLLKGFRMRPLMMSFSDHFLDLSKMTEHKKPRLSFTFSSHYMRLEQGICFEVDTFANYVLF